MLFRIRYNRRITRDEFEDLYIRFLMFLDGLPRNYKFETIFEVFLFYIEQSRNRIYIQQKYSEKERYGYIREEIDRIYSNMDEGRRRQRKFIDETFRGMGTSKRT